MIHRYSKEQKAYIADNCAGRSTADLTKLFNLRFGTDLSRGQIRAFMQNHGLANGVKPGHAKGYSPLFTDEQQAFIKNNCNGITSFELTDLINAQFNTSFRRSQIKGYLSNHGLTNGVDCRIKKGAFPVNKGKKWADFMSEEGMQNSLKTTFQKGEMPHNHKPVGSERICSKDGYIMVKIAEPKKWTTKQRVVWEEAHGPIPKGHKIIFLDGNKLNVELNNLALVSNGEELIMNKKALFFKDPELTTAGMTIAKIIKKTVQKNGSLST